VVHVRHVHWRAGADWLVAHLLDGDLASNHLSWQWVAGTGSSKPYLFNAENVARFAPPHWHSPGTVVDQSYEAMDRLARAAHGALAPPLGHPAPGRRQACLAPPGGMAEPLLFLEPPGDLGCGVPGAVDAEALTGRDVWLVHPWALREPPADLPEGARVIGLYLQEHHRAWPWPEARWRWVDAAMSVVTPQRWFVDAAGLARALAGARSVRSAQDPHLTRWIPSLAQWDPVLHLFPPVERHCSSFSQWWTRATRGRHQAQDLL
jgi:deoxyribodipyrimidine photo-lyase